MWWLSIRNFNVKHTFTYTHSSSQHVFFKCLMYLYLYFLGCKGRVVSDLVGGFKHPGATGGS